MAAIEVKSTGKNCVNISAYLSKKRAKSTLVNANKKQKLKFLKDAKSYTSTSSDNTNSCQVVNDSAKKISIEKKKSVSLLDWIIKKP